MAGENHKMNLQLQNTVAQLGVLKSELAEGATALTEINTLVTAAKAEYEDIKAASAALLLQSNQTTEQAKDLLKTSEEVLERARQTEQTSLDNRVISDEGIVSREAISAAKLQEHSRTIVDNETKIVEHKDLLLAGRDSLDRIHHEISSAKLTLEDLHVNIRESSAEFAGRKQEQEQQLGSILGQIEVARQELGSVLSQIDSEREKISAPMAVLKEEEGAIENKRADILIYETRVRDQYRLMFPDRAMKL